MPAVAVSGSFDDLRSRDVRFLQEAARLGELHVRLWSDRAVESLLGQPPKFPESERQYFVESIRFVHSVAIVHALSERDVLLHAGGPQPGVQMVDQPKLQVCQPACPESRPITAAQLQGFPSPGLPPPAGSGRKKVLLTGSFDWLHTGHVRFFEEAAQLGDVYAVVGHDANIALLKGPGHPQFPQAERLYMVQAIRFVTQAAISTGHGWLDAEPEIIRLRPDIYAVNEDGDKPEKRNYCNQHGIQYVVLKRLPKPGLPRESRHLRGF